MDYPRHRRRRRDSSSPTPPCEWPATTKGDLLFPLRAERVQVRRGQRVADVDERDAVRGTRRDDQLLQQLERQVDAALRVERHLVQVRRGPRRGGYGRPGGVQAGDLAGRSVGVELVPGAGRGRGAAGGGTNQGNGELLRGRRAGTGADADREPAQLVAGRRTGLEAAEQRVG